MNGPQTLNVHNLVCVDIVLELAVSGRYMWNVLDLPVHGRSKHQNLCCHRHRQT